MLPIKQINICRYIKKYIERYVTQQYQCNTLLDKSAKNLEINLYGTRYTKKKKRIRHYKKDKKALHIWLLPG